MLGCSRAALIPGDTWLARDEDGGALPVCDDGSSRRWRAFAHTGGRATALACEWDGRVLRVIGVEDDRGRWQVEQVQVAPAPSGRPSRLSSSRDSR